MERALTGSALWPLNNLRPLSNLLESFARATGVDPSTSEPTNAGRTSPELVIDAARTSGEGAASAPPAMASDAPAPVPTTLLRDQSASQQGDGPLSRMVLRHLTQRRPSGGSGEQAASVAQSQQEEGPAAAAERHRLLHTSQIDFQALAKWLELQLPYLVLLSAVFLYHHCSGIFMSVWMLAVLCKTNQLMRQHVAARRGDVPPPPLSVVMLYAVSNVGMVVWLTSGQRLWRSFALLPPTAPTSVWQAAFMVLILDSMVRVAGSLPKLLVVLAAQHGLLTGGAPAGRAGAAAAAAGRAAPRAARRQARLLTLCEYLLMGYRTCVPVPIWYTYLLTCTLNNVLCSLLAGFYLTFKAAGLLRRGRLVLVAVQLVWKSGAPYGEYVGKDEAEGTGCCPICQEPCERAVRLECRHTFCEECIGEWLERDRTCPLCRTNVKPPGLQSFADGATTLLPQLF